MKIISYLVKTTIKARIDSFEYSGELNEKLIKEEIIKLEADLYDTMTKIVILGIIDFTEDQYINFKK